MPYFSVIIPTYNRAGLIAASLDSVLGQTFTDYELIVVDDGSTDATRDVLAAYADRVRVIVQSNAGPGPARNRGIAEARGRYIAFLDSDDVYFPFALDAYHQAIERLESPALVLARHTFFRGDPPATQAPPAPLSAERYDDFFAYFFRPIDGWIGLPGTVVRADAAREVGGFVNQSFNAEDHDLFYKLGTHPGFVHIREPVLLAVRRHDSNVSTNIPKTLAGISFLLQQERRGRYPGGKARRRERQAILSRCARSWGFRFLEAGDRRAALTMYLRGMGCMLTDRNWKFILGFPVFCAIGKSPVICPAD